MDGLEYTHRTEFHLSLKNDSEPWGKHRWIPGRQSWTNRKLQVNICSIISKLWNLNPGITTTLYYLKVHTWVAEVWNEELSKIKFKAVVIFEWGGKGDKCKWMSPSRWRGYYWYANSLTLTSRFIYLKDLLLVTKKHILPTPQMPPAARAGPGQD